MLDRIGDWKRFHRQILLHIEQYTIPQYQSEDAQKDQVGAWTSKDCVQAMQRYINRHGKNMRGNKESLRDMLKIAHYAQFAHDKLKEELGIDNVYEDPNKKPAKWRVDYDQEANVYTATAANYPGCFGYGRSVEEAMTALGADIEANEVFLATEPTVDCMK